jgi:hypothetical protein
MISAFERATTVHALDRAATVIGLVLRCTSKFAIYYRINLEICLDVDILENMTFRGLDHYGVEVSSVISSCITDAAVIALLNKSTNNVVRN